MWNVEFDHGGVCMKFMEVVQWLYDKHPESVDLEALRDHASYMPALLTHILDLEGGGAVGAAGV